MLGTSCKLTLVRGHELQARASGGDIMKAPTDFRGFHRFSMSV